MARPSEKFERYRPVSGRRRLLIAGLAVATAVAIILLMLDPALRLKRAQLARDPGPARCVGGNLTDCVGGKADVILLPMPPAPAPAASQPG